MSDQSKIVSDAPDNQHYNTMNDKSYTGEKFHCLLDFIII